MPRNKQLKVVIYARYLPRVGGVETAILMLMRALRREYQVVLLYEGAESWERLMAYSEFGDVIRYIPEKEMKCDVCIVSSNLLLPQEVKAKRYIQWVHSDYEKYDLEFKFNEQVDTYVAVSKHSAKVFRKLYKDIIGDRKVKVIYNLLNDEFGREVDKRLRLVTNSRISPEKGFERMLKFARMLKEKYAFSWMVYGDNSHDRDLEKKVIDSFKDIEEVKFVGYKSDIVEGLEVADYLVQFSDFEGCPYAILEALKLGVPCLVTNWKGAEELIEDGVNGYVFPMDLEDIDLERIFTIPKVEPMDLSTGEDWFKLIEDMK